MNDKDRRQEHPPLPDELHQAGTVVDRAVAHMIKNGITPIAAASALLGGALGVLSRSHSDAQIVRILESAIDNVRRGGLDETRRQLGGGGPPGAA
ncbi:MAG: hypothetical protein WD270_06825 [Acetobacterales bacterium]